MTMRQEHKVVTLRKTRHKHKEKQTGGAVETHREGNHQETLTIFKGYSHVCYKFNS